MFLGIDQSLNSTGVALISPRSAEPVVLRTVVPGDLRDGARLAFIRAQLLEVLSAHPVTQVAMEGYSMGSTHRAFDLGEVGGLVKCLCAEFKVPLISVAPVALKKFCCGNVGADKEAVMRGIKKKWGVAISQNDMADAYVLAKVAACYATGSSVYREELEVVHALKKPKILASIKARATGGRKGSSL